jgi:hypothetical protein
MTLEIQVLTWDGHTHVTGLNCLMASQPSPLESPIANKNCAFDSRLWLGVLDTALYDKVCQ